MTEEIEIVEGSAEQTPDPAGRPEPSDILDMIDDLLVHLHEAKSMPLSSNALVDRDMFLGRLEQIRASLPDELRAARWMVREREAFIARTNEKAREIVNKAREEADRTSPHAIVRADMQTSLARRQRHRRLGTHRRPRGSHADGYRLRPCRAPGRGRR